MKYSALKPVLGFAGHKFRGYLERQIEHACEAAKGLEVEDNLIRLLDPPVPFSRIATREQELDFLQYRSPSYVPPMSDGVVEETLLALNGENAPEPYDARTLARLALNSTVAYLVTRDGDEWVLDYTAVTLFPYRPLTVAQFRFDLERDCFRIIDIGGHTHRPGDPTWDTAVTHALCWAVIAVPAGAHNWVHFALPDVVASVHERMTLQDSNVWRLLAPHVRFTNRINYQGLWIQRSTSNAPTLRKALVPWISAPFYEDQFRGGVMRNTQRHYANFEQHFELPRSLDERIPYFAFLREYYEVCERFATAIDRALEEDAWQEFAGLVDHELPGFAAIPRRKALAVLLWQVGVVHICDHSVLYPHVLSYGFMKVPHSLQVPYTRENITRHDRWKTRCFAHAFITFNPSPGLDQRLVNVESYGFATDSQAHQAALDFRADLLATDARLASEGRAMVPVDQMIQSICF
ncbi:MAG TPA: hypothetical protein VMW62_10610 [Chloroflexota bacterium]|nr:hypothetical protein [Chloroflexota bacterium]